MKVNWGLDIYKGMDVIPKGHKHKLGWARIQVKAQVVVGRGTNRLANYSQLTPKGLDPLPIGQTSC